MNSGSDLPLELSTECRSYVAYRDYISRNTAGDVASYCESALERVREMMIFATGDDLEALARYEYGITRLADLFTQLGEADLASLDLDAVAGLVEDLEFDQAERDVWRWAGRTCGLGWTGCTGFLNPLLDISFTSEYGFLIDPENCNVGARDG